MNKLILTTLTIILIASGGMPAQGQEADTGQRITVSDFAFTGNSVIDSRTLSRVVEPFAGADLTLDDLKGVADSVSAYYHSHGYFLAQTILPEQDIENGIVTLQVFEGKLGQIIITGDAGYSAGFLKSHFKHMYKEGVIKKGPMERALMIMNDLPGITVTSVLQSGQEQGATDVVVTVKKGRQFGNSISVDNFGSKFARVRAMAGFDILNQVGRGSVFSLNGVTGMNSDKLYYFNANYRIPLDANGTTLGLYGLAGDFGVGKEFAVLDIQGQASAMGVSVAWTTNKGERKNTVVELGLDARNSKQDILGATSSNDKIRTLRMDVRRKSQGSSGRTFSSFTATRGLGDMFGGMRDDSPLSSRSIAGADGSFTKFGFEYGRAMALNPKTIFITRMAGQYSLDDLVVGEQFSIGGPDSVRGYPQAEHLGDSGVMASLEARFGLSKERMDQFQIAAFYDIGRVSVKTPALGQAKSTTISGAGLGLRYNPGKGIFVRTDVGFPLGHEASSNKSATYYLQFMKQNKD